MHRWDIEKCPSYRNIRLIGCLSSEVLLYTVYIFQFIQDPEFRQLVLEDANAIKDRQETDTIAIIDDIRFHFHKFALPGFEDNAGAGFYEDNDKLLAELMTDLGLDA